MKLLLIRGNEKRTFKSGLANFWYYYKWHTLAIIIVLITVAYGLYSCVGKVQPDIVVFTLTENPLTYAEDKYNLKHAMAPYVSDYNGDGKVCIEIENYYVGSDYDSDLVKENLSNFKKLYTAGTVMLIMADEEGAKQISEIGYFGDISDIASDSLYNGTVWASRDSAFASSDYLQNWDFPMYWGVRVFNEKSLISISKDKDKEFEYAKGILDNMIKDNRVYSGELSE